MGNLICKIVKNSSGSYFIVDDGCSVKLTESPIVVECDSENNNICNIYDSAAKYHHNKVLSGEILDEKNAHLICFKESDALKILSGREFKVQCPKCNKIYNIEFKNYCDAFREEDHSFFKSVR